jgi:AMP-binding enzyme
MAGGIAVAVNTRSSAPAVQFVLNDAGVKADLAPQTTLPDGEAYVEAGLGHADVAAMFYTSGTTRHPKSVPTTHEAFLANTQNMIRCLGIPAGIGPELRTLISVPLFHVAGCNSQLLVTTQVGGASVIMPVLDQPALIAALPAERITFYGDRPGPSTRCSSGAGVRRGRHLGRPVGRVRRCADRAVPGPVAARGVPQRPGVQRLRDDRNGLAHDSPAARGRRRARRLGGVRGTLVDLAIAPRDDDPTLGELVVRAWMSSLMVD